MPYEKVQFVLYTAYPSFLLSALVLKMKKRHSLISEETWIEEVAAYDGVDQALWTYFQAFEEEARDRGFNIDLRASKMTGEITAVGEDGAAGLCSYQSHMHLIMLP